MKEIKQMSNDQRAFVLMACVFLPTAAGRIAFSVLPLIATSTDIQLINLAFTLGCGIAGPCMGLLYDVYGKEVAFFLSGVAVLLGIACSVTSNSIFVESISLLFFGIGYSTFTICCIYVSKTVEYSGISKMLCRMMAARYFAVGVAPLLGTLILQCQSMISGDTRSPKSTQSFVLMFVLAVGALLMWVARPKLLPVQIIRKLESHTLSNTEKGRPYASYGSLNNLDGARNPGPSMIAAPAQRRDCDVLTSWILACSLNGALAASLSAAEAIAIEIFSGSESGLHLHDIGFSLSLWGFLGVVCICTFERLRSCVEITARGDIALYGAGLCAIVLGGLWMCWRPAVAANPLLYQVPIAIIYALGYPLARTALVCVTVKDFPWVKRSVRSDRNIGKLLGVFFAMEHLAPVLVGLLVTYCRVSVRTSFAVLLGLQLLATVAITIWSRMLT